ncbi:VOC family protein [Mycolicibacterium iranicum]|nr:VOC family protein [Mycolicibacterium iranicum]
MTRSVIAMTHPLPLLHHVVFAVGMERLDSAAEYLTALGFQFQAFALEHLGLQVRLDWDRGFELIAPTPSAPTDPGTAAEFLARNGDGLFSVIVRFADCDAAEHIAARYGAFPDFRQHHEGDGFQLTEVKLQPLFGIPLTLMTTDLPDEDSA